RSAKIIAYLIVHGPEASFAAIFARRAGRSDELSWIVAMRRLILASASPRRRELLTQAGYTFEVWPAHGKEDPHGDEEPIAYVVRLARDKAQAVFSEIASESLAPPQVVVLGADTTVTLDGHILAKPEDAADAARMLRMLSGRTHRVITGVAVV